MRLSPMLFALAACDPVDPCSAERLDERCAGAVRLGLDDGNVLVFQVVESLVTPDRLYLTRLTGCDEAGTEYEWQWQVHQLGSALVQGLRYGEVPDSARETVPPTSLVDGETYGVWLARKGRHGGGGHRSDGWEVHFRYPDVDTVEQVATFDCPSWWVP